MRRTALLWVLLLAVSGCGTDEEPSYLVEYQIGMSSMEVIPPADATEPLVVRLTGIIGPDTRYRFDHADVVALPDRYEITLFGVRDDTPGQWAVLVLVEWSGREFRKQPPHGDSIRVVLHQPDGTTLEEVVEVGQRRAGT